MICNALHMIRAAAEPMPVAAGEWRWIQLNVPNGVDAEMRRIQLRAVQKHLVPVHRSRVENFLGLRSGFSAPPSYAYNMLFRGSVEFRRNAVALYALAKKLGARDVLLDALDPRKLTQNHVFKQRVSPGSEIWKFLAKYGFQAETVEAAAEPPRHRSDDTVDALNALLMAFKHGKRLPNIKGCSVEVRTNEGGLLVLAATSPDQRTLYSMQAYEAYDIRADQGPCVEAEVYTEGGRSVLHRMPDQMTKDQLLRKLLRLLADRIPGQAHAAAEPGTPGLSISR